MGRITIRKESRIDPQMFSYMCSMFDFSGIIDLGENCEILSRIP